MSKRWDYQIPSIEIWKEVMRVLKPGGHALVCCGTRTQHRMVVNVEDAGFEVKDVVVHLYGSGFPKSLNIKKSAISSGIGCQCETSSEYELRPMLDSDVQASIPTEEAVESVLQSSVSKQSPHEAVPWSEPEKGFASGEKSSLERRSNLQANQGQLHRTEIYPVSERISIDGSQGRLCDGASPDNGEASQSNPKSSRSGSSQGPQYEKQSDNQPRTISKQPSAQNCGRCGKAIFDPGLGTALKPAAEFWTLARKPLSEKTISANVLRWGVGGLNIDESRIGTERIAQHQRDLTQAHGDKWAAGTKQPVLGVTNYTTGRWPANLLLDETAAQMLDEQTKDQRASKPRGGQTVNRTFKDCMFNPGEDNVVDGSQFNDSGGASRFFYVAKASKRERNAGLDGEIKQKQGARPNSADASGKFPDHDHRESGGNNHPTVKPIKLMEYLCKLITPPNGTILDPFCGSGSTLVAAHRLGFKGIGIEQNSDYVAIAEKRIAHAKDSAS